MKRLFVLASLSAALLMTDNARADLIVTFGPTADIATSTDKPSGPFAPNESVTIPVLAHWTGEAVTLSDFTLPIDFGGDGVGTGVFQSIGFRTGAFSSYGELKENTLPFLPYDRSLTGSTIGGVAIGDSSSPTLLFELTFTISSSAANGVYDIISQDSTAPPIITKFIQPGGTPYTNFRFDQGQIEVSGVPELGTFLLLGFSMATYGFFHFRRRKSNRQCV